MNKINTVFIRIVKEMLRDKRTLILMFAAPLFIMTIINFFSLSTSQDATIGVARNVDQAVVKNLKIKHLKTKEINNDDSARQIIK